MFESNKILAAMLAGIACIGLALYVNVANAAILLEPIHGARVTDGRLLVLVTGHGCTKSKHFHLFVEKGQHTSVSVFREGYDRCRRAPSLTEVSFDLADHGLDSTSSYSLVNKFSSFAKMSRESTLLKDNEKK